MSAVIEKQCQRCEEILPISAFPTPGAAKCKDCKNVLYRVKGVAEKNRAFNRLVSWAAPK